MPAIGIAASKTVKTSTTRRRSCFSSPATPSAAARAKVSRARGRRRPAVVSSCLTGVDLNNPSMPTERPFGYNMTTNMRTLATQVRLRRLIRTFAESFDRLSSEPLERRLVGSVVDRLLELSGGVRESWRRESVIQPLEAALEHYVGESLRSVELAIA